MNIKIKIFQMIIFLYKGQRANGKGSGVNFPKGGGEGAAAP